MDNSKVNVKLNRLDIIINHFYSHVISPTFKHYLVLTKTSWYRTKCKIIYGVVMI